METQSHGHLAAPSGDVPSAVIVDAWLRQAAGLIEEFTVACIEEALFNHAGIAVEPHTDKRAAMRSMVAHLRTRPTVNGEATFASSGSNEQDTPCATAIRKGD